MKLLTSPTSPFARKIVIAAHELGLALTFETVTTLPTKPDLSVQAANPIGKIPTLVLDNGASLFDSRVILEYLCDSVPNPAIMPHGVTAPGRFEALRLQAVADGITDAAVLIRYETFLRPKELVWPEWIHAQELKIASGLNELNRLCSLKHFHVGEIAAICAVDYLVFRAIGPDVFEGRSNLKLVHAAYSERASVSSSKPA
jgi:glutathione S-transferase